MFATLLGALPPPTDETGDIDRLVEVAVRAQESAGLEPITDGRLRGLRGEEAANAREVVDTWRSTQSLTGRAVKQVVPGPFSSGMSADAVAEVVAALAEAGCPLVEIEETAIGRLADGDERAAFRLAHERLLERASATHLSLSIVGPSPHAGAWPTILELPYASLAVDLINGPDSWNLVTRWPGARGVIAGVESARRTDEPKELLLWAAHYAASTTARGRDRVGIGSAGSWASLTWDVAVRKMYVLGEAARLAALPPGPELAGSVKPSAVSSRAAALGTTTRPAPRAQR